MIRQTIKSGLLGMVFGVATLCGCNLNNCPESLVLSLENRTLKNQTQEKKTYDIYGENIIYKNFSEIDFDEIPKKSIKKPKDLERLTILNRVEDKDLMKKILLDKINELGYGDEDLNYLSIKNAIELSVNVATSGFKYLDVDNDESFIKRHGERLPIEKYFEIGLGDCDKYRDIVIETFNLIKKNNDNLVNVYAYNENLGGRTIPHAWNSFFILGEDKVILTHLDPTFYGNGGNLEARRGYHISEKDKKVIGKFYSSIKDFENSYDIYRDLLEQKNSFEEQENVLMEMVYLAGGQLKDLKKLEFAKSKNMEMGNIQLVDYYSNYYSAILNLEKGNEETAREYAQNLVSKYPQYYFSKDSKIRNLLHDE